MSNPTDDLIGRFLAGDTMTRLRLATDPDGAQALRRYFGEAWFSEFAPLAQQVDQRHLAAGRPVNLVFVPGVMGSYLKSKHLGGVWWFDVRSRSHLNDIGLAPDGSSPADVAHDVEPCAVDPSYEPFLAAVLARDDFGHTTFAYDWRKPLAASAAALRDLVVRVHTENGGARVNLVAHSMGGLMVRTALMAHGNELWPRLNRIVFVATPHYGATAIAGYLKNHFWGYDVLALLGRYLKPNTFRTLWGVLSLLPAPAGIYPGTRPKQAQDWEDEGGAGNYAHPCANFEFYRAEAWQLGLSSVETTRLQQALDATAAFHMALHDWHTNLAQSYRDRMLMIAGVGYQTLFRLAFTTKFWGYWKQTKKVTDRVASNWHREGDGRVPLASAHLENVLTRYVKGIHGDLPNVPAVYRDVFHWLNDEPLELPETPQGARSAHMAEGEAPLLARATTPIGDDPGLWQDVDSEDPRLDPLQARLEEEQLPEIMTAKLL
jgi:hypothetical protein